MAEAVLTRPAVETGPIGPRTEPLPTVESPKAAESTTNPLTTESQQKQEQFPKQVVIMKGQDGRELMTHYYATVDAPEVTMTTQDSQGKLLTKNVKRFMDARVGTTVDIKWNDPSRLKKGLEPGELRLERYGTIDHPQIVAYAVGAQQGELQVKIIKTYEQAKQSGMPISESDRILYAEGENPLVLVQQTIQRDGTPFTIARLLPIDSIPLSSLDPQATGITEAYVRQLTNEVNQDFDRQKRGQQVTERTAENTQEKDKKEQKTREKVSQAVHEAREKKQLTLGKNIRRAVLNTLLAGYVGTTGAGIGTAVVGEAWVATHPMGEPQGAVAGGLTNTSLENWDRPVSLKNHELPDMEDHQPGTSLHDLRPESVVDTVPFDATNGTYWNQVGERVIEAYNLRHPDAKVTSLTQIDPGEVNAIIHANMDVNPQSMNLDNLHGGEKVKEYSVKTDEALEKAYESKTVSANPEIAKIQQKIKDLGAGISQRTINQDVQHAVQDGSL